MLTKSVLTLSATGFACIAAAQPSFETIGNLRGGLDVGYAFATSHDGSVVTGYSYSDQGISAYRWTSGKGMQELPRSNGPGTYETSEISPSGEYIAGQYQGLGAVWSQSTGTVQVGDLPGGTDRSFVWEVSDQGVAVGQSAFGFNQFGAPLFRATRWSLSSGLEALPLPDPADEQGNSSALGVLDDGRIFGQSESGAWFYSENSGFEMLPGAEGMVISNQTGTILAGLETDITGSASVPAYWTPDEGLVYLPGSGPTTPGTVRGISEDGSIMVGRLSTDEVVWLDQGQPMEVVDFAASLGLDMDGWIITSVFDVSGDGTTIVGSARHLSWGSNRVEPFVLTIPAPGTIGVLGLALFCTRRRR